MIRDYLSVVEVAVYLGITPDEVYDLMKEGVIPFYKSTSGQYRFKLEDIKPLRNIKSSSSDNNTIQIKRGDTISIHVNNTIQTMIVKSSTRMEEIKDNVVNLVITSPPYFNAKLYGEEEDSEDLGNIHDLYEWFEKIRKVYKEIFRVLQPGRKFFLNIMNLPVRDKNGFRSLNIVGKTIDICEEIGFIFKREIIWQKTNSVKSSFGSYPYPGGILLNFSHEFILEFEKPAPKGYKKYAHVTKEQKEKSKLDKEFWIEIKKSDIWIMSPAPSGRNRKHPAPFPEELPYRIIKAYSYVGETVLDPFAGIGTTLLVASQLERNGIGYEINPSYVETFLHNINSNKIK